MNWEDLQHKSEQELTELLSETRNELRSLQFQANGRQLKQVSKIKVVKKTIARINLLLSGFAKKK